MSQRRVSGSEETDGSALGASRCGFNAVAAIDAALLYVRQARRCRCCRAWCDGQPGTVVTGAALRHSPARPHNSTTTARASTQKRMAGGGEGGAGRTGRALRSLSCIRHSRSPSRTYLKLVLSSIWLFFGLLDEYLRATRHEPFPSRDAAARSAASVQRAFAALLRVEGRGAATGA